MVSCSASQIPPLCILLSYPFFWRPTKICEFVHKTLKILRDTSNGREDKWVHKLKRQIYKNERTAKYTLWPAGSNWKQVLDSYDPRYFEILTTEYYRGTVRKVKLTRAQLNSVSYFLKIIRDKHEHCGDIPVDKRKVLGWYTKNKKGEFKLDDKMFLQFWTSKFPRLVSFMWLQFRRMEDELEEYYPYSLNQPFFNSLSVDLDTVLVHLSDAILDNVEQGGLQSRYSTIGAHPSAYELTLEFRTSEADMIQNVLCGKSAVAIDVIRDSVTFTWQVSARHGKVTREMTYRSTRGPFSKLSGTCIIISNGSGDTMETNNLLLSENGNSFMENKSRLLVITNGLTSEAVESTVASISKKSNFHFEQKPLKYEELRESRRKILENETVVYFQNRLVNFSVFLPKEVDSRMSLLSWFSGDRLNDLLKRKQVKFLSESLKEMKYVPGCYKQRRQLRKISGPENNKWDVWKTVSELDVIMAASENSRSSTGAIAILGEVGMGNTAVIERCAGVIWKMCKDTCVIVTRMSELMERFKTWSNKTTKFGCKIDNFSSWRERVTEFVVSELVGCSHKFEENVVKFWLYQKRSCNKLKFDLMFDSLEDIRPTDWELAYDLLKTISEDFPSVRVWVTGRTYLQNEIETVLNTTTYLVEGPFVHEEERARLAELPRKLRNLAGYFKGSQCEKEKAVETRKVMQQVENFARYVSAGVKENMLAVDARVTREVDKFTEYVMVAKEHKYPMYVMLPPQEVKLTEYVMTMLGE